MILESPEMAENESNGTGDVGKQRSRDAFSLSTGKRHVSTASDGNRRDSVAARSSAATELPPQFGRYRVKKKLGGGGMGTVYLVENTELEREEALKVPHFSDGDDPQVRERFLREAKSAAKLDHANLCPIYVAGVQDGTYYLTMRFLKGRLLSDFTGTPQPVRKSVEIATKLAQALEAAHSEGVIHRDLKPSNIMMVSGVGPVVMDFGLAKLVLHPEQSVSLAGTVLGTPAYMPPEQVNGDREQMGPASDVYSLGVILYELLTGRLPFEGTVGAIYGQILYAQPRLPSALVPGLNPALDAICRRAMAKASSDRYPSMRAFAADLLDFLRSTPVTAGAGNLVPNTVDKAAILQSPTAAPGPLPADKAAIFQAPTVRRAGYPRTRLPFFRPPRVAHGPAAWGQRRHLSGPHGGAGAVVRRHAGAAAEEAEACHARPVAAAGETSGLVQPSRHRMRRFRLAHHRHRVLGLYGVSRAYGGRNPGRRGQRAQPRPVRGRRQSHCGLAERRYEGGASVKPGTRKVELKKGGFRAFGEEVTLEDHGRTLLVARLKPDPKPTPDEPIVKPDSPKPPPNNPRTAKSEEPKENPVAFDPKPIPVDPPPTLHPEIDPAATRVYLSDLEETNWSGCDAFGKNGRSKVAAITVDGVGFPKGLWTHPPASGHSTVQYRLSGLAATAFVTKVAINDSAGAASGSMLTFQVLADEKALWTSAPSAATRQTQECRISLNDARVIRTTRHTARINLSIGPPIAPPITLRTLFRLDPYLMVGGPLSAPSDKPNPPVAAVDLLPAGSVWKGTRSYRKGAYAGNTVSYELYIRERDGTKFKGHKFDNGTGRNRLEIEGEINGDTISWSEQLAKNSASPLPRARAG